MRAYCYQPIPDSAVKSRAPGWLLDVLSVDLLVRSIPRLHRQSAGFAHVPISLSNSRLIHAALRQCGIKLVSTMPETWLVPLVRMIEADPDMSLLRLAKEEEGVG